MNKLIIALIFLIWHLLCVFVLYVTAIGDHRTYFVYPFLWIGSALLGRYTAPLNNLLIDLVIWRYYSIYEFFLHALLILEGYICLLIFLGDQHNGFFFGTVIVAGYYLNPALMISKKKRGLYKTLRG